MTNYAEMTEEQIILRELEVTAREADLLRRLRESKLPRRAACINGDVLRASQPQSVTATPRKRRSRSKSKPTRGDGKAVCQFGCGFSAEHREISDSAKSLAVGNHHKAEHWSDMQDAVLEWANQGKTQGEIADFMVNALWVGTNTAPKWTAQMIEQLTVPSSI